jgi:hypothetical protein
MLSLFTDGIATGIDDDEGDTDAGVIAAIGTDDCCWHCCVRI